MKNYDAIIIGSGQGGTPLAKKLARAGYSTALIERRWVGGTCVNDHHRRRFLSLCSKDPILDLQLIKPKLYIVHSVAA